MYIHMGIEGVLTQIYDLLTYKSQIQHKYVRWMICEGVLDKLNVLEALLFVVRNARLE